MRKLQFTLNLNCERERERERVDLQSTVSMSLSRSALWVTVKFRLGIVDSLLETTLEQLQSNPL